MMGDVFSALAAAVGAADKVIKNSLVCMDDSLVTIIHIVVGIGRHSIALSSIIKFKSAECEDPLIAFLPQEGTFACGRTAFNETSGSM